MSTHGPVKDLLKQALVVPVDVKAYSSSRQAMPENYPCKVNNGMCSHLCLLSPVEPGKQDKKINF